MSLLFAILIMLLWTASFGVYKKYLFKEKFAYENGNPLAAKAYSKQWHKWELVFRTVALGAMVVYHYLTLTWQDFVLITAIGMAAFVIAVNLALGQKWYYVGATSATDIKYGKKQWWVMLAAIVAAILNKILNRKKK